MGHGIGKGGGNGKGRAIAKARAREKETRNEKGNKRVYKKRRRAKSDKEWGKRIIVRGLTRSWGGPEFGHGWAEEVPKGWRAGCEKTVKQRKGLKGK